MIFTAHNYNGLELHPPSELSLHVPHPWEPRSERVSGQDMRAKVAAALEKSALRDIAKGKRRVCIVIGDLSLPAAYPIVLPEICKHLETLGIRASRITLLTAPGGLCEAPEHAAAPQGRAAIRIFGEEVLAGYDLRGWGLEPQDAGDGLVKVPREATHADGAYAAADLRIVVLPDFGGVDLIDELDPDPDFALSLQSSLSSALDIAEVRTGLPDEVFSDLKRELPKQVGTWLLSGGGAPTDATLEEALLSVHHFPAHLRMPQAPLGLIFDGSAGLGSARFTLDVRTLLAQAGAVLADGGSLAKESSSKPKPRPLFPFDPAGTLAAALTQGPLILFAPGLHEHEDGDDLRESIAEFEGLSNVLRFAENEAEFWFAVTELGGAGSEVYLEPLGWRRFVL